MLGCLRPQPNSVFKPPLLPWTLPGDPTLEAWKREFLATLSNGRFYARASFVYLMMDRWF